MIMTNKMPVVKLIPLTDLILGSSPPPIKGLIDSIREHGIFELLLVYPFRNKYKIIAGNRRARATKVIAEEGEGENVPQLPCRVLEDKDETLAAMVATNNLGKRNPLTDLEAINLITKKLMAQGKDQLEITRSISKQLRLAAGTQKKRLRLNDLIPDLKIALCEGQMTVSVAEKVSGLSEDEQKELLAQLIEHGRVTTRQVKELREVGAHKSTLG